MKGILGVLVGAVVVVLVIMGVMSMQNGSTTQEPKADEGRVYFSITDDTADIQSVNDIEMEVEDIQVYSQAEGWTRVSSNSKTYPLLTLKASGKVELHEAANVAAGTYDRVKVTLGDVVVDSETKGRAEATLPSEEITFDINVNVNEGSDSHVTLDFIADKSLHTTTEGEFVFAPVVEAESRSNTTVEVGSDNAVTVTGGSVDSQVSIGVDLDGSTKANFTLDSSAGLEVDSSIIGETTFMLGGETYTKGSTTTSSESNAEGNGSVEVDSETQGNVNVGNDENGSSGSVDVDSDTETNINY